MATLKPIITLDNIREVRSVSGNLDDGLVKALVLEAQEQDLKPVLGDEFFYSFINDMAAASPTAANVKLADGGTWTNGAGDTVHFRGVKEFLSYATFARLVTDGQVNLSRTGPVNPLNDQSQPAQPAQVDKKKASARAVMITIEKEIRAFLDDEISSYTLYKKRDRSTVNRTGVNFIRGLRIQQF